MKPLTLWICVALACAFSAIAQPTPVAPREATVAQMAAGSAGDVYVSPRRAAGSFEVPLTFSTGLTRTTNTVTVDTTQNINTINASNATEAVINGGTSGAQIKAGQGANAAVTLTTKGTGGTVLNASTRSQINYFNGATYRGTIGVDDGGTIITGAAGGDLVARFENNLWLGSGGAPWGKIAGDTGVVTLYGLTEATTSVGALALDGGLLVKKKLALSTYGDGSLSVISGIVTSLSDGKLKNYEGPFSRGLEDINRLSPALYRWRPESGIESDKVHAGFIAQNVATAIPEAVSVGANGILSLNDRPILAAVVNATKELAKRPSTMEIRIFEAIAVLALIFSLHASLKKSL